MTVMTTSVRKGAAGEVVLPEALLLQAGLVGQVCLAVEAGKITISTCAEDPQHGWEEQYRRYAAEGGDEEDFHEPFILSEWEEKEWEW